MRALLLATILGIAVLLGVGSAGAVPGSASLEASDALTVSSRIGGAPLSGRITLGGSVVWTATTSGKPDRIQFLIDGNVRWTETAAPYRYKGSPNGLLDTTKLANGTYTFEVKVFGTHGRMNRISSSVRISNRRTPTASALPSVTPTATVGTSTAGGSDGTSSGVDAPALAGSSAANASGGGSSGGGGGSSGGGSSSSAPSSGEGASPFVEANGTSLALGGQPYRFTGINIYMAASGGTPSSCGGELYPDVGVPLSNLPSGIVFRFWAFQNFFVSGGAFDWTNLDNVLSIAAAHGDKVIPVLANQYAYCDPPAKDLAWYQSGYQTDVDPGDIVPYEQYVSTIVSRYANNPTIAMWQLVNEGEAVNDDGSCNESAALSALTSFSNTVGGLVHQLDPNHLVSLGTIAGYSGSGSQWCGAANGDYQTLMASAGDDVCDFHDYGYPSDPMGNPTTPDLATAIQMCHADGKPIMVAETGIYATSDADLSQRAAEFTNKFTAQFQAGVVGELMWDWAVAPDYVSPASDPDYGMSPGDPALGVLSGF